MDRCYRPEDRVYVFESKDSEKHIDVVYRKPYHACGFANYRYRAAMFGGYRKEYGGTEVDAIYLDHPLHMTITQPLYVQPRHY